MFKVQGFQAQTQWAHEALTITSPLLALVTGGETLRAVGSMTFARFFSTSRGKLFPALSSQFSASLLRLGSGDPQTTVTLSSASFSSQSYGSSITGDSCFFFYKT